jgi:hypothetical protein
VSTIDSVDTGSSGQHGESGEPGENGSKRNRPSGSAARWVRTHRRLTAAAVVVVVLGLVALADWPHRATHGQLRADYESYVSQVRGDVLSCGTEVQDALSAYNQIRAGVSTKVTLAKGIMSNAALDCTPSGNAMVLDIAALQPPRSLAAFSLEIGTNQLYGWASSDAVDAMQQLSALLDSPGNPAILRQLRALLGDMQQRAAAAQSIYDRAAKAVGAVSEPLGLDEVQPGVLVG